MGGMGGEHKDNFARAENTLLTQNGHISYIKKIGVESANTSVDAGTKGGKTCQICAKSKKIEKSKRKKPQKRKKKTPLIDVLCLSLSLPLYSTA